MGGDQAGSWDMGDHGVGCSWGYQDVGAARCGVQSGIPGCMGEQGTIGAGSMV